MMERLKANQEQVRIIPTFPSANKLNYINSSKKRRTFMKFAKARKGFYSPIPFIFRLVEQRILLVNCIRSTRMPIGKKVEKNGVAVFLEELPKVEDYKIVPSQSFFSNYLLDERMVKGDKNAK